MDGDKCQPMVAPWEREGGKRDKKKESEKTEQNTNTNDKEKERRTYKQTPRNKTQKQHF